jgi:hypothetical protein
MFELDWSNQHKRDGKPNHIGSSAANCLVPKALTVDPDNPRGKRSRSKRFRCKPHGEWNTYNAVCVDGNAELVRTFPIDFQLFSGLEFLQNAGDFRRRESIIRCTVPFKRLLDIRMPDIGFGVQGIE